MCSGPAPGGGLCQALGQHVVQPAGQADRHVLAVLGPADLAPVRVTVARSASRLATSRLTVWRTCSTPRSGSTSLRRSAHSSPARSAVEREFRPTQERVGAVTAARQGLDRVRLHADLTISCQARPHASRPARRLAAVERPPDSLPQPSAARRRTSRMIETMTAMTNATVAIVRAFMGRLPGLQQRSRRPYSVSLARSPEPPSRSRKSGQAAGSLSAAGCSA